jgi:GAF domain-containing protein
MNQDLGAAIGSPARLAALRRLALLDTPPEPFFDGLTRLAAALLHAPMALISLVDEERQFFKSQVGLAEPWASRRETPLAHALCRRVVATGEPLVVADARDQPPSEQGLGFAAFVAVPLTTAAGHTIGALCVADAAPRAWASDAAAALREIAGVMMAEIEIRAEAAERRRAEAAARRLSERAARLQEGQRTFFELLATGAPLAIVLKSLAHTIETQLLGGICSILLLDDEQRLRHGAAPSLPAAYTQAIDGSAIGEAVGSCGTAAYRGVPVIVADIASDPLWVSWRELALQHGLRACWSVPFQDSHGATLGTFAIYYREPRVPSALELQHVATAAHLASVVVERRRIEEDHERLIAQLREALANVKTLRGLLPICASCKKIRDDRGYWNQIEIYLQAHSEADFTHGICPDCARRLYGDDA